MAFGDPRSSCVCPGTHYAQRQDSRNDLAPCRMALPFVSAGAHAPHSDRTPGPTATRGTSHSARRLRSLAFLCSSLADNCKTYFELTSEYDIDEEIHNQMCKKRVFDLRCHKDTLRILGRCRE